MRVCKVCEYISSTDKEIIKVGLQLGINGACTCNQFKGLGEFIAGSSGEVQDVASEFYEELHGNLISLESYLESDWKNKG